MSQQCGETCLLFLLNDKFQSSRNNLKQSLSVSKLSLHATMSLCICWITKGNRVLDDYTQMSNRVSVARNRGKREVLKALALLPLSSEKPAVDANRNVPRCKISPGSVREKA
ncbi:hypothetical protein AVEN_44299-1 [Araneus ventricosus]|uniref:Uncharacterized protein n=1 Tax=Araneus ventricosus TaxID=182803 RepID=A0A4Y2DSD5_ARAVE|nr:hypothetical protein AVEN_44299-1 [Araneus ventricosus]